MPIISHIFEIQMVMISKEIDSNLEPNVDGSKIWVYTLNVCYSREISNENVYISLYLKFSLHDCNLNVLGRSQMKMYFRVFIT